MNMQMNTLFSSSIGIIEEPKFLPITKKISNNWLDKVKQKYQLNSIYPVVQTENLVMDPSLVEFNNFVLNSSYDYLDKQGYDLSNFELSINSMWCQEHYKTSGHEKHVHGNGAVISAFYMLECPDNSSHMMLYDPRLGRDFGFNLPEKDERNMSEASSIINYGPSAGELIITNSFIPHGFSRNMSDKPFTFLHIDIYANFAPKQQKPQITNNSNSKFNYGNKAIVI